MTMNIKEIHSKSILSPSKVYDYVINPYVGCQHGCSYCYARFMKRFSGHKEPWGQFVDVRNNAPDLLQKQICKKTKGTVWISGLCDPYQPLENKYTLTRRCLEILVQNNWPVVIQTRSALVLRDMDLFREAKNIEVGLSITSANDEIRKIFELNAPPTAERLKTIDILHQNGIKTYVMIAPILPQAENLVRILKGKIDYLIIDRMNYHHADWIYHKYNWNSKKSNDYFKFVGRKIMNECKELGIDCRAVYEIDLKV